MLQNQRYIFCNVPGILSRLTDSDVADMKQRQYEMIRVVVCNLYPFSETVANPSVTIADAVENIDIGQFSVAVYIVGLSLFICLPIFDKKTLHSKLKCPFYLFMGF